MELQTIVSYSKPIKINNKLNNLYFYIVIPNIEATKPKCVNPILNIIGVNSLRVGGLNILYSGLKCRYNFSAIPLTGLFKLYP